MVCKSGEYVRFLTAKSQARYHQKYSMKLYRLTRCLDQYGLLTFNGDHLLEILGRRVFRSLRSTTQSISETWPEIHGWFDAVEGNVEITDRPDLYLWNDTILVLSPKARSVLNDQLKNLGEFLPFDCGGSVFIANTAFGYSSRRKPQ